MLSAGIIWPRMSALELSYLHSSVFSQLCFVTLWCGKCPVSIFGTSASKVQNLEYKL